MKRTIGSKKAITAILSVAACLSCNTGQALTTKIEKPAKIEKQAKTEKPVMATGAIAAGTVLTLTLDQALSSETNQRGEKVRLSLAAPLVVGSKTVLRAGTTVDATLTMATPAGRLARAGRLGLELGSVRINGRRYELAAVHRDTLQKDSHRANSGALRRMFTPVGSAARKVLAANGRDPLPASATTAKALEGQSTEKAVTAIAGARDPLARVELDGDSRGGKWFKTGMRTLTRAGTGYAASLLSGPLALMQRGEPLEVAAGTSVYAVVVDSLQH